MIFNAIFDYRNKQLTYLERKRVKERERGEGRERVRESRWLTRTNVCVEEIATIFITFMLLL